jgi:peroxiredoxin
MAIADRRIRLLIPFLMILAGCEGVWDDLSPSGNDKRPAVSPGTTGPAVGQIAPDFTLSDTLGNGVTLSTNLSGARGVVLYFTMWCPACDVHMSHMRGNLIPVHTDVRFFAVDYISGSVADARNSEIANGYSGSGFTVLADIGNSVLHAYAATMGTTVVIDNTGVVRMNEDYRNGAQLQAVLQGLP